MQDPFSMYPLMNAQVLHPHNSQSFPEQENLKCPRCDSTNTKFCYFNNYNLSQPRHYCRNCRRYWTKGGSLRNVPVGGGSRKNAKRTAKSSPKANPPSTSQGSSNETETETASEQQEGAGVTPGPNPNSKGNNLSGYFGKLIQGGDTLGSLMGPSRGHFPDGFGLSATHLSDHNRDSLVLDTGNSNGNARGNDSDDGFLSAQGGDADRWNGTMGPWPDLHIYTPGSTFQ